MGSRELTVSLPDSVSEFIRETVSAGRYHNASEVVADAIQLLRDRQSAREALLAEICEQIEVGARQAEAGELLDGPSVFREIRSRIRRP